MAPGGTCGRAHTIRVLSAAMGGLGGAVSPSTVYVSRGESGFLTWGDACCLAERGSKAHGSKYLLRRGSALFNVKQLLASEKLLVLHEKENAALGLQFSPAELSVLRESLRVRASVALARTKVFTNSVREKRS